MAQQVSKIKYDIPFVPSSDEKTLTMMRLARIRPGDKAVDLGAGEGKLVVAMAKKGAQVTGIEIDGERAIASVANISDAGLEDKARIIHSSFWEHDISPYDIIVLYGVPSIMKRLGKKIKNEAKPAARVLSNHFTFPGWRPAKTVNNVYLYRLP